MTYPASHFKGIPDGNLAVENTLQMMKRETLRARASLPVRFTALRIVQGTPQTDRLSEIRKIHGFVRDSIRYVRDARDVEILQSPEVTLDIGQGDCDDKALLLSALLESIGFTTRFRAVGFNRGEYSHVLTDVLYNNEWLPLETTMPVEIGWEPPGQLSGLAMEF